MTLIKSTITSKNFRKCLQKWPYTICRRMKSTTEPKIKTYSHTITFPKTKFPARSNNTVKQEIEKSAQFSDLYNWQRENLKGPEYVLHDGPPYANGDLHMGHSVNKIIKDINNRSQVLQGNKVHYIPGWDCHGLPIELKALQKAKKKMNQNEPNDPLQIRQIARNFASETVENQKAVFKSWGIMADWDSCYLTMSKSYVQNQLHQFYKMYEKGLAFRALKPVYWSPSSKTALAEAELEYDPQHKSTEVYVSFPIETPPQVLKDIANGKSLSAIIWTTTPWTLVANRAICYNPVLKYSCFSVETNRNELYIAATGLLDELQKVLNVDMKTVIEFDGHHLENTTYTNSLVLGSHPFLAGDHVTESKGTGLVHTAPAHGPDDFLVALKNNMEVVCNVDESGRYINLTSELNGLAVLEEGQEAVIAALGRRVLCRGTYVHSYPLDWRTKKPVILRASTQWFLDTNAVKEKALSALSKVSILPPANSEQSRQGFRAQIEKRPYWCISRQRAWGVPIPALYDGHKRPVVHKSIIERLCELVESKGTDAWWTSDVEQLIPEEVVKELNLDLKHVIKGQDILDIWFDSGISWSMIGRQANLYSEGLDQLTGWFQSSLLTSVALTGEPPYKSIFVHGFVVDEKKRKMSKSIGNVIDPTTIIHGGKNKNVQPAYGIDTLRWWVASHSTQHSQIIISKKLLDDCHSEVSRIRNILKYLLSAINGLSKHTFNKKPNLNYFDQYLIQETDNFLTQMNEHYNSFRYNYAAQLILNFISNKVSALYCHCVKDRLYCSKKESDEMVSAQLVIHTILVSLSKALGPILPHLIEEVWSYHPLMEKPFHFTQNVPVLTSTKVDLSVIGAILEIKKDLCTKTGNDNLKKFTAYLVLETDFFNKLEEHRISIDDLCEILEVSSVTVQVRNGGKSWSTQLIASISGQCLRCRKYNAIDNSDRCLRCEKVLAAL